MLIETTPRLRYILLGRFAPFHLGHQKSVDSLINRFGLSHVLIIIGSSSSYNSRTPYTYEERRQMILAVYPEIEVLPLPDTHPSLIHFDGQSNQLWLDSLEALQKSRGEQLVFIGGSQADLAILAERFKTLILVDRHQLGHDYSATEVREALDRGDITTLTSLLSPAVLPLAIAGYRKFQKTL